MSAGNLRQYRFKQVAQWNTCLIAQGDQDAARPNSGISPFPPYAETPTLYKSNGAQAPVVLHSGEILWSDKDRLLHHAYDGDETDAPLPATRSFAFARRVISTAGRLWVASADRKRLESYDDETMSKLLNLELANTTILDLARGEENNILLLVRQGAARQCVELNETGDVVNTITLKRVERARRFVYLSRTRRLVVLSHQPSPYLYWFTVDGGEPTFSKLVTGIRPDFEIALLSSDSNRKIILAGVHRCSDGPEATVLVLDAEGELLTQVPLDTPATGITATREDLIVTTANGLLQYAPAAVVPTNGTEIRYSILTPMLQSLEPASDSPWLRADASVLLPEGTTLELGFAATDRTDTADKLRALAEKSKVPTGQRIQQLLTNPELVWSRTEFQGRGNGAEASESVYSAPLFDLRGRYLWVSLQLTAAPGARLPLVKDLNVHYPGHSLIEQLPTPYRRAAAEPGSFLRAFVGVLEATTQNLDERIAAMGSHIHPETADVPWMDYVARWLSLPWDDALTETQKRCILGRAADLAKGRGTRAGLEALLECLFPGSPQPFRVTDPTADFGYAVLGGEQCAGSALPAMLGGYTRWHSELDTSLKLGYTHLPRAGQSDDSAQWLSGRIRVEIAAPAKERKAAQPWLRTLLTEMLPLMTRLELRWVSARDLRTDRLDETLKLEAPPDTYLGTTAVSGLARLPQAHKTRLGAAGPALGTRLK